MAGYEFDFDLTPAAKLKFWRRGRKFSQWAAGSGEL
jgi:hypothetical protein